MIELKRDQLGIEPLHFMIAHGTILAAPTIKELMQYPQYCYRNVQAVRGGHTIYYDPSNGRLRQERYYELPETEIKDSTEEASAKIRALLEKNIEDRLEGVKAVMLSGGIDSVITSYLSKQVNPNVVAYSLMVKGSESEYSDLPYARRSAKELGLELIEVEVSPIEVKESIDDVIFAAEDKRDYNIYSAAGTFFLAKKIAKDGHRKVACGEGPDEIFGSYDPWGSHQLSPDEAMKPENRRKFVKRLEWNLFRGTKVSRYLGLKEMGTPIEMVSPYLKTDFVEYAVNLPAETVNVDGHRKGILARAFQDVISDKLRLRGKIRFQDGSGITPVLRKAGINNEHIEKVYNEMFRVCE